MNVRKRRVARHISMFMCLLVLLFAGFPSQMGQAQQKPQAKQDVSVSLLKSHTSTQQKISKRLEDRFAKEQGKITFLVKLKDQVNTKKVAQKVQKESKGLSLTQAQTELRTRSAVVSSLRAKALETQDNLKEFLQKQKQKGSVKSYESFYIVNAMAITGTKEVAKKLAAFPEVEKVLPNETRHLFQQKRKPVDQKSLIGKKKTPSKKTDQTKAHLQDDSDIGPNLKQIGVPNVWAMGIDGTGTVVASIDTGVQWDHPALKNKYRGYDPAHPDQPNNQFNWFDAVNGQDTPYDDLGHGTHTMGTMVGSEPDGSNQIGVAPGAKWISVKAFTAAGGTDVDLLEAGQWILAPTDAEGNPHPEKAPDVVSNSWGGGPGLDEWYRPMVQNWRAAGIVPVFAAGNTTIFNPGGPGSVASPGNYPEAIAVGAVNDDNVLADFSLLGPSPYGEIKPELVAPGVTIRSSVPGSQYDGTFSGTSMATPHVAGTVALLKQADASLTVDQIENILLNTATPLTDEDFPESPNNGYGHGLVNAFEAVSAVTTGLGTVKGQVGREGEDDEPPTFQHEAPDETYAGLDLPLQIAVQDNVSIKKVQLQYRSSGDSNWQTLDAKRSSGDYREAVYTAAIPGEAVTEPSIAYRWKITDYGANEVTSDIYEVVVKSAITVGYSTDFETVPAGWASYGDNNSWEWGKPTFGPDQAFSGEKVYGTNLDGNYDSDGNMTLIMPPINLPEGNSYLQFKQWYDLEDGWDYGHVFISSDRENWEPLNEITGTSNGWIDGEINLSQYAGQRVYIGFNLSSDGSFNQAGWYLDNVSLSDTPLYNDTEPPTYSHEAPDQTYTGMNLPLKINVQDNIRVEQVELQYHGAEQTEWQTVQAELVNGDPADGTYNATIPGDDVHPPSITYRWHIVDYGGNEVTSDSYEVTVKGAITTGYNTDFETDPGWVSYGIHNSWERGAPTSGPDHAVSGENVYATNLDGNYEDSSDSYLMMPPVSVPEGGAFLQFKQWYKFESRGYDSGDIVVSTDQQNWDTIAHFTGQSNFWQYVEANLSDYAGQQIFIAFHLDSDGSNSEPGWYLDDVTLSDTSIFSTNNKHLSVQQGKQATDVLKKIKTEDTLTKLNSTKKQLKMTKDQSKPIINPDNIQPGVPKNVKQPIFTVNQEQNGTTKAKVSSLPLQATVTVLETGQSVKTNPADGSYSMVHPAGTYTLQAESYGFYPQTQSVEIPKGDAVDADFTLQPIPMGTLTGTVTNKKTGEPISGATLMLMEDAAIPPVQTDENGHYSIKAYEGTYTLHVLAPDYYSKDIQINIKGNDTQQQDVQLKPFIGYPGEIAYDDGTGENARAFYDAGNGWAVRMSLPEGHDQAMVKAGKFRFWTTDWPTPGGTDFKVAVYDASGPNGAPGRKLAGPIDATAQRNGDWTIVDLSDEGIIVDGDFYIVYIQSKAYPNAPGLATDESSPNAGRSWQLVSGSWSPSPEEEGNYMIRALVSYEVVPPTITAPEDGSFTNQDTVTVKGKAAPTTDITIYNNGEQAATASTADDGTFSADITLVNGQNKITATASTESGTTAPSKPVTITLDQQKPGLVIDSPKDGWKTNEMAVSVEGTATDDHLAWVKVNGEKADVQGDGSYVHRMLLNSGENQITVVAADKAGNKRTKQISVFAKFEAPVIQNLKPTDDHYLDAGQTVKIEMDSEPGLEATFAIRMPLTNPTQTQTIDSVNELPMMETADGHYVGYWTATSDLKANGAQIEVIASDDYGNVIRKLAEGKLYINIPNETPEARIDIPRKVNRGDTVTFEGSSSTDSDGTIEKYEWNFGDGHTATGPIVEHIYSKKGKYKVTLTVTDNRGAKDSIKRTLRVQHKGRGKHHGK
ncbi:MAG TPA: S8 family serine peptidase [Bacillales bacterium]|nr:S8 family serine peptidase [Bacillales bacterium]